MCFGDHQCILVLAFILMTSSFSHIKLIILLRSIKYYSIIALRYFLYLYYRLYCVYLKLFIVVMVTAYCINPSIFLFTYIVDSLLLFFFMFCICGFKFLFILEF